MYNKFFATEEEAKEFQKIHGGKFLKFNTLNKEMRLEYIAETAIAWDKRHEEVDVAKTPYCVAWGEK